MSRLVNDFAWSSSRGRKLDDCARAYFWSYYGSWEGWEKNRPHETREAYRLKKLSNRWTWSGDIVHAVVARALGDYRAGRSVNPDALILGAQETMRRQWKASKKGPRNAKDGNDFWGLVEHEYREPIEPEVWRDIWNRTASSLRAFFSSRLPGFFAGLGAEHWIEIDGGNEKRPPTFELEGVDFYAIPDLVVSAGFDHLPPGVEGPRTVYAFDWKTGRPKGDADRFQMVGYALYLEARYRIPLEEIRPVLVYLRAGEPALEVPVALEPVDFNAYRVAIRDGLTRARSFLVDGDTKANKPKPRDAFPMTEDRRECSKCEFRRLCGR